MVNFYQAVLLLEKPGRMLPTQQSQPIFKKFEFKLNLEVTTKVVVVVATAIY